MTNRTDGAGVSFTNWFNNQGGLIAVSNAAGQVLYRNYDEDDRIVSSRDKNGVSVTNTYDYLYRLSTRTYPDGGEELFTYSAFGLIGYTNQLGKTTTYGYNAILWKTWATTALKRGTK